MTTEEGEVRVLLVDDEPNVLRALARSLCMSGPENWTIDTATDHDVAIERLAAEPYDVVVSDLRLGGDDGGSLLRQVALLRPGTLRFILTGRTEIDAAVKAIPIAHGFLSKPINAEDLVDVLVRALKVRARTRALSVVEVVGDIQALPPSPRVHQQLVQALRSPKTSATDVARIVGQDPAIASRVLHVANSAFFRGATAPSGLSQAVARLGLRVVSDVVLAVEALSAFDLPRAVVERQTEHGAAVAAVARALVQGAEHKDLAFTAGLLHDIGHLVIWCKAEAEALKGIDARRAAGMCTVDAEREVLGVDHAEAGAFLLELWDLPDAVVRAVGHHHQPLQLDAPVMLSVQLAEAVVNNTEPPYAAGAPPAEVASVDELLQRAQRALQAHREREAQS